MSAVKSIPLAGVIGQPIAHSLSPRLHGHWLRQFGINGHYVPMEVAHTDLKQVLETLPKLGFRGINVTVPHKEAVLHLADSVSDRAALIGAANTLTFRKSGRIHADNTDGHGFMENLRQNAPDWEAAAGPAIILGAGGAARAVIASLIKAGVPQIIVANRTRTRANQLAEEFGARLRPIEWTAANAAMGEANLLVNTTSLGMTGKPDLKTDISRLPTGALVTDIVYAPLETRLLAQAREQGNPTVDGLGMLLHQAIPGFETWFNRRPEVDDAARAAVLGDTA